MVALAALAFFCVLAAYYVIRPVRDQLAGATGSIALPWFYAGTFLATLTVMPAFGWLAARLPRRQLLAWSYGFFIACLVAFVPLFAQQPRIGARELGIAFFIWVSVFNLFVVSLFWSLMVDLFDAERAQRVFALIALGGALGALAGPILTTLLVQRIGVAPLLLVSAALLAIALGLMLHLSSACDTHRSGAAPIGGSPFAGLRAAFADPFLRLMALLMLCSDGVGTLAYALVADYAKAHFADVAARTAFYGHIDLAVNVFQMVLQVGLTRWMLARFGIVSGLVLPAAVNVVMLLAVALFGAAHFGIAGFAFALVPLTLVVTRSFAYGVTKPASDALYARAAREVRYKGKNFVETAVWRFGDVTVASALDGMRALGATLGGIGLASAAIAGLAGWLGWRAVAASGAGTMESPHAARG
ncbi:MAG: translocase [Lysobacterales bacterium 66-474]|nr:MAG: translocase [Rhodanobacter sp. SCN 66-43]OJY86928.1 MAG: translocase [Xanthomonadales bacterium 66-474]